MGDGQLSFRSILNMDRDTGFARISAYYRRGEEQPALRELRRAEDVLRRKRRKERSAQAEPWGRGEGPPRTAIQGTSWGKRSAPTEDPR